MKALTSFTTFSLLLVVTIFSSCNSHTQSNQQSNQQSEQQSNQQSNQESSQEQTVSNSNQNEPVPELEPEQTASETFTVNAAVGRTNPTNQDIYFTGNVTLKIELVKGNAFVTAIGSREFKGGLPVRAIPIGDYTFYCSDSDGILYCFNTDKLY